MSSNSISPSTLRSARLLAPYLSMTDPVASPGTLKIFLGMCPGVGKTYSMLEAARELRRQGIDVVVGVVETHGRKETASLLADLEVLPLAKLPYRGTELPELDLDALLARRPKLALVDELAHTNAPGSRHPKRWQDVAELLDAGIDVFTTLNIQHLESRADVVGTITRTHIRETVPDSFLDLAKDIELIDLTPRDLLRRLEEGKVYLGDRAHAAASNFFRESHLTALRQLALRYTAERVGVDLNDIRSQHRDRGTWRIQEKLIVAVGPSPFSPSLIRRARAMAGALDATWSAIAVQTDELLTKEQQDHVTAHLSLARQLGAEATTVEAISLVEGLLSAARERGATQIVVGKSPRHRWRDFFRRPPALALLQASGEIDVIAVEPRASAGGSPHVAARCVRQSANPARNWDLPLAVTIAAGLCGAGLLLFPVIGAPNVALLMLCGVILGALKLRSGGTVVLAILTALLWNFFFTEPRLTFHVADPRDLALFIALTIAALSMGSLSNRLQRRNQAVLRQQRHNARLLEITTILTRSPDNPAAVGRCVHEVTSLFDLPCSIQLRGDDDHQLQDPHPESTFRPDAKERGVAAWAFEKKQPAGRGTSTLPEARALHLPLQGRSFTMGILSVDSGDTILSMADRDLLAAVAAQLGLALERDHLLRAIHHAEFLERSEQLRRSLLDHVSHELRTPVAIIGSALDAFEGGRPGDELISEMRGAHKRLRRVVEQLVESARIESGAIRPQPEWWDLSDLCENARERSADSLASHPFRIEIPSATPPLVWVDGELLLAAIGNLLNNTGSHTPPDTPVELHAGIDPDGQLEIRVRDHGKGLTDPARVFDRFHRGPDSPPGGLGLGLSIVRGLMRGLGGQAEARNASGGGAEFILRLPVRTTDTMPQET
jgi:two-component system sensor histidine kinase KdpD